MYPARALIMGMEERQQLLVGLWTKMTGGGGSRVPPAGSAPCCVRGPGGSSDWSRMISGLMIQISVGAGLSLTPH